MNERKRDGSLKNVPYLLTPHAISLLLISLSLVIFHNASQRFKLKIP